MPPECNGDVRGAAPVAGCLDAGQGGGAEAQLGVLGADRVVQGAEDLARCALRRGRGPDRVPRQGGQGRRLGTLAADVADHRGPGARAAAEDVVEVAAHLIGLASRQEKYRRSIDGPRSTRGQWVTKDEIKIGITYPDLEAIRSVTNTNHGDYEKSYRVVIDDLNKQGGINGRKVVPVFAAINPLGTAPAQEACLKLTEDEKVFAAMSFFNADAPLCFVDSHDTPILGGQTTSTNLGTPRRPGPRWSRARSWVRARSTRW